MTLPESRGTDCWPDDHDYLDGRTEMFLPSQDGEEIRGYWDSDVLDLVGHSLRGQINVGEPFQVRFRAETRPGELWADATGDWTFDLAFSPIGSGSGFNLSNLLPSPSVLKVGSWRGADTRCIEVVATVPAGLLPESGGLYQVAAVIAFQPTGGKIAPISETQPLGSYSLQPQGGQRDQVEWVSDAPAPEDRLRREPLARTLATRLRRFVDEDPGTSFLIHIDGPWGAGKTTLLNLLRQELEHGSGQELEDGSAEEPKWLAITFNAWRQSRIGAAWWALLAALRHDLGDLHRLPGRAWLRVAESWARFRRAGAPFVLAFTLLLAAAAAVFALLRPHKLTFASSVGLAQGITAVVAAIGILWAGALVAGRFLLWDSARGARLFEQSNTNPMRDVAAHFGWLITKAKRPVVFFIDDLDRCTDSYVVELLDTIQTLVRDVTRHRPQRRRKVPATAAFVIAADGAWIRESYEITYAQFTALVAMPGRSLGYLFLDKLFQLHVPMPTIDPAMQQEYLRSILRVGDSQTATKDSKAEEQLVRKNLEQSSSEGEVIETLRKASPQVRRRVADAAVDKLTSRGVATATEHHLERFGSLLEPNPRAMKKFVNDYSILRAVRTLEGNSIGTDPLALWTIIEIRWPAMAGYLRTRPEAIKYMRGSNSMPEDVPADLHGLFNDPNIRELANFQYGGPLTPELIRACCGAAPPG